MSSEMIHTDRMTRKFGDFIAVNALSFSIAKGEIFGFLGANGAGKTTAIRMLTGLLAPTSGSATVAGFNVSTQPEKIKQHIGYMNQRFSLYEDLTPRENIRFWGGIYGLDKRSVREKGEELLAELELMEAADTRLSSLPLGWKQKLAFSVALMHDPSVIFLDEPTGGVDPVTRRRFWDMIYATADKGITVFVTTHYMDEAEYCDRVSIMVDGCMAAIGTPETLKKESGAASIDELFVRLARPTAKQGEA
ncbi:MAG: ABC transporter ATP-binding protein [Chlorobiaceae bacterium]|nr:ABC transporter ATP-binding protein [Chlorobiaceae bacterium]